MYDWIVPIFYIVIFVGFIAYIRNVILNVLYKDHMYKQRGDTIKTLYSIIERYKQALESGGIVYEETYKEEGKDPFQSSIDSEGRRITWR